MLKIEFGRVSRVLTGLATLGALVALPASDAAAQAPDPAVPPGTPSEDGDSEPPEQPPTINLTGAPSPGIDLSTPEPGPRVTRKFHNHEGFYLRVAAGLGSWLSANVDSGAAEVSTGGLTLNYDLLVGGSPAPGFTLGGGVLGGLQMSGDWESDSGVDLSGGDMTTLLIGPFADGHPQPNGGLHFGGLAGLARVAFDAPGGGGDGSALGFGGAFWAGHDVWVAPEWSLGGQLRLDALRATDDDTTVTEVGLTLMFSVLYH
jgi:hypothetical protein